MNAEQKRNSPLEKNSQIDAKAQLKERLIWQHLTQKKIKKKLNAVLKKITVDLIQNIESLPEKGTIS